MNLSNLAIVMLYLLLVVKLVDDLKGYFDEL